MKYLLTLIVILTAARVRAETIDLPTGTVLILANGTRYLLPAGSRLEILDLASNPYAENQSWIFYPARPEYVGNYQGNEVWQPYAGRHVDWGHQEHGPRAMPHIGPHAGPRPGPGLAPQSGPGPAHHSGGRGGHR
jgi:hypothetical protein